MAETENSISAIKAFFSTEEKPCTTNEIMQFWKSLTLEEKEYYKTADLS